MKNENHYRLQSINYYHSLIQTAKFDEVEYERNRLLCMKIEREKKAK